MLPVAFSFLGGPSLHRTPNKFSDPRILFQFQLASKLEENNEACSSRQAVPLECWEWIENRVRNDQGEKAASHCPDKIQLHPLSDQEGGNLGFCNSLYLVRDTIASTTNTRTIGILKLYSELAQKRMALSGMRPVGSIDNLLGDLGIGPQVYGSSEKALFMAWLENGVALTEKIVHSPLQKGNKATSTTLTKPILANVARSLARLHSLSLPSNNLSPNGSANMLWDSIDVLLERIPDAPARTVLRNKVQLQRSQLEGLQLPVVSVGHGDFKPSNVMLLKFHNEKEERAAPSIRFIDLETAGSHYRAFDLAKFFRTSTPTPHSSTNQDYFLQNYYSYTLSVLETSNMSRRRKYDLELLRLESQLLLPMTWLEATIFFYASQQPPNDWKTMADIRWHHYELASQTFSSTVKAYQETRKRKGSQSNPL